MGLTYYKRKQNKNTQRKYGTCLWNGFLEGDNWNIPNTGTNKQSLVKEIMSVTYKVTDEMKLEQKVMCGHVQRTAERKRKPAYSRKN